MSKILEEFVQESGPLGSQITELKQRAQQQRTTAENFRVQALVLEAEAKALENVATDLEIIRVAVLERVAAEPKPEPPALQTPKAALALWPGSYACERGGGDSYPPIAPSDEALR